MSTFQGSKVRFQKKRPEGSKRFQTRAWPLLLRRYKERRRRVGDVQQVKLVHIHFCSHLSVAVVDVPCETSGCSLAAFGVDDVDVVLPWAEVHWYNKVSDWIRGDMVLGGGLRVTTGVEGCRKFE